MTGLKKMTEVLLDLQRAIEVEGLPSAAQMQTWIAASLLDDTPQLEITVRVVGQEESASLNQDYRQKAGPTNVLSFAMQSPDFAAWPSLGDLVICAPLVAQEAQQQNKSLSAHWAHLLVHGLLHLQGLDHLEAEEAERMEAQEIRILDELGFGNPYV